MLIDSFVSSARRFPFALSLAACLFTATGCTAEMTDSEAEEEVGEAAQAVHVWPDHVAVAAGYVSDIVGIETHNIHDPGSFITLDATGHVTEAKTQCAPFITLLLKNTYSGVITDPVMTALTGSLSPSSALYYNAIDPALHPSGNCQSGVCLSPLDAALAVKTGRTLRSGGATLLQPGDILASKYTLGSNTGHTMTVGLVEQTPGVNDTMVLAGEFKTIPGVTNVRRWLVRIYDSTSSPHGSKTDWRRDSRYLKDVTEPDGNDTGIGTGYVYLYENADGGAADGQLVGWSWSMESSSTFEFTNDKLLDKNGSTAYRPMMIGRFSGSGL